MKPTKSAAQILYNELTHKFPEKFSGGWAVAWTQLTPQERNRWRNYAKSVMREIKHQEAQQAKDIKP